MIHTHGRATNSPQPSTRSRSTLPRSAGTTDDTRRNRKAAPAAANITASTAMAHPGPNRPTATPPIDIPANMPSCLAIPTNALA